MARLLRLPALPAVLGGLFLLHPPGAAAAPTQPGELINPLQSPQACDLCHGFENALPDFGDPDYSPLRSWQGSLMANSARDPVFWAGLAVADADSPGQTELCVRCHAPRAFLSGNGAVTAIDQLLPDEDEGIECAFCHRVMEDETTPAGNAQYTVDDVLIGGINVPRRGPWDYTDGVPEPPHTWIPDLYMGESRFCGTCHDVTTEAERVDDLGNGLGTSFNEQRTYSEWRHSAYATPGPQFRSCQGCHMPAIPDKPGCTAHVNQYSHPVGGRRHDMVGANRFMVEVLRDEYGSAGENLIADFFFDNTIEAIDAFLPTAATLEVEGPTQIDLNGELEGLLVTVTNETGHKLPSGYSEGRIMWLEVVATYRDTLVYSSGRWDQEAGIQPDAQLRTYEGIAERWSDGTTFHLLLNDHWVEDTRIPPLGLVPDLETDPVGDRYVLLPNGTWPNYDQHTYSFPAAPEIADLTPNDLDDDELSITVRLRYLINTPEYIDFLAAEAGEAGSHVANLFEVRGGAPPVTITEQTLTVPIVGFGPTDSVTTTTAGVDTTAGPAPTTSTATSSSVATSADTTSADTTSAATTGPVPPSGSSTASVLPGTAAGSSDASGGPSADGDPADRGCSCHSGTPGPTGASLLPWLLLGLRRRRVPVGRPPRPPG